MMLLEFQNNTNIEIINVFWICLSFVRYRFEKYRFVRYTFRFVRYRYPQQTFCFFTRRLEDFFKARA